MMLINPVALTVIPELDEEEGLKKAKASPLQDKKIVS
jgi:hypothetical protein